MWPQDPCRMYTVHAGDPATSFRSTLHQEQGFVETLRRVRRRQRDNRRDRHGCSPESRRGALGGKSGRRESSGPRSQDGTGRSPREETTREVENQSGWPENSRRRFREKEKVSLETETSIPEGVERRTDTFWPPEKRESRWSPGGSCCSPL